MDCRTSWTLALSLSVGLSGCLPTAAKNAVMPGTEMNMANSQPPPGAEIQKEVPGPKTRPVGVAIAYANMKESEGDKTTDVEMQVKLRDVARQAYQETIGIDPKNLQAQVGLGRIYSKLGNHDKAVETFTKTIKQYPKESMVWYELSMCHNRRKNWNEAIVCLNKALEVDPENRLYPQTLGYTLARAGRIEESLQVLGRQYGPAQAQFTVARMMFHLKQPEQAKRHLLKAVELDPNFEKAQSFLAFLNQPENLPIPVAAADLQFKAD